MLQITLPLLFYSSLKHYPYTKIVTNPNQPRVNEKKKIVLSITQKHNEKFNKNKSGKSYILAIIQTRMLACYRNSDYQAFVDSC